LFVLDGAPHAPITNAMRSGVLQKWWQKYSHFTS